MLNHLPGAQRVVDGDGTDGCPFQLPANDNGWQIPSGEFVEQFGLQIDRVGNGDDAFYSAAQEHVDAGSELCTVILQVRENGKIAGGAQVVLDTAQDLRTVGVSDIKQDHAQGM